MSNSGNATIPGGFKFEWKWQRFKIFKNQWPINWLKLTL
jgi:hypothetical protein